MALWVHELFRLLQILNDLSIRHSIKLILYENDVKLLNLRGVLLGRFMICLTGELLIPEMNT